MKSLFLRFFQNRGKKNGGEGGIRTHGTSRFRRSPSARLRPLGHFSAYNGRHYITAFQDFHTPVSCISNGGEGGIRTHGAASRSIDFESIPFDHSGTSPHRKVLYTFVFGLPSMSAPFMGEENLEQKRIVLFIYKISVILK